MTSLHDEHSCPKRRDNKLVTSTRIADRFESLIRANPAWSLHHLQATVQQEMFANVSLSKCKRAKAIVMARWLDRTKGEYSRVYDYQEELLRSNPGSTIVVKLDKDYQDPVFQRFYVCLNACKKVFLAGCRKVVGLDGCFFKERRREPQEKPKGRRLSKRGTVIRCRKCKQTGHNRSTCDRRNSGTSNMGASPPNVQPAQSQSNVQPAQSQAHVNSLNAMVWTDTSSIYSQVPFHDMYI